MTSFVRYAPTVETVGDDEAETFAKIGKSFVTEGEAVAAKQGSAKRTSHAKATGLLTGELTVHHALPVELAQGLFATAGRYDALVRFAQGPGEDLPDSTSTHRGMAVKILGVTGEHIAESREHGTQDFLTAPGESFIHSTPKTFLADFRVGVSKAAGLPAAVKKTVSKVSAATNAMLKAVGTESKLLGFFGHPSLHPVGEIYFSQAPMRWGDYIAKVAFVPTQQTIDSIATALIDASEDDDAFRHAMMHYFAHGPASFDVRVQLCTDLETMPVENAAKDWSQDDSAYRTVGTLTLPRQMAYGEERRAYFDERLAFSPAHSLAAHRPLGGIMRARLAVYGHLQDQRQAANRAAPVEPQSASEVPA